jgi:DNA polymerase III subunit delta
MTFDQILQNLKARQFAPVYFLQGDEPYFIDVISDYIEKNALAEMEKGFNQVVMYGKDADVATILLQAKRFPMMSDRSVVIVKEAQSVPDLEKDSGIKQLEAYLKNPLPSTILVFAFKHKTLDGRKSLAKTFQKHSVFLSTKKLYENQVPAWINDYLKQKELQITPRATQMLSEFIGADLSRLANEMDKLSINAKPGQTINEQMVQENVGISKEYNIFELQTALINGDALKANKIIRFFESNPKNYPLIPNLGLLFSLFTKLLQMHVLPEKTDEALKKILENRGFLLREYKQGLQRYPVQRVVDIIHHIRVADLQSKGITGGNLSEADILRELIFKIMHPVPAVPAFT